MLHSTGSCAAAAHERGTGQRGAAPLETPPEGAALWTPAKGLRPSRHPFGCIAMGMFSCGGHGARQARRDAKPVACRCGGRKSSAPTGAGRGLCDRPLHSFAHPDGCYGRKSVTKICQMHLPYPSSGRDAKVSKGRPQIPLVSPTGAKSRAAGSASRRTRHAP